MPSTIRRKLTPVPQLLVEEQPRFRKWKGCLLNADGCPVTPRKKLTVTLEEDGTAFVVNYTYTNNTPRNVTITPAAVAWFDEKGVMRCIHRSGEPYTVTLAPTESISAPITFG